MLAVSFVMHKNKCCNSPHTARGRTTTFIIEPKKARHALIACRASLYSMIQSLKEISMRTCTGGGQDESVFVYGIDEEPVRSDMAFAKADAISDEGVVTMLFW